MQFWDRVGGLHQGYARTICPAAIVCWYILCCCNFLFHAIIVAAIICCAYYRWYFFSEAGSGWEWTPAHYFFPLRWHDGKNPIDISLDNYSKEPRRMFLVLENELDFLSWYGMQAGTCDMAYPVDAIACCNHIIVMACTIVWSRGRECKAAHGWMIFFFHGIHGTHRCTTTRKVFSIKR